MPTFDSILQLGGKTATGIEVPPEVIAALGTSWKPAVIVHLNTYRYHSTIAVLGGRFMLPVSAQHREGAGITAGDTVHVTLELDQEIREVKVPSDLRQALDQHPTAQEKFERLSYSRQRQHVLSVEGTADLETRAQRVVKVIGSLLDT
ncbi:YdeI/OmpD-associated family protein [Deinococcus oregonensis]|uniref:YdeI/OmpD-associated family protein n=1 Tax=Deinococcus oregonensis TaxID=1805970 RepID=A0ABV6AU30_9DEIO